MQHIETITLASTQTSFTFASIPDTFTDLVVLFSGRTGQTDAGGWSDTTLRPNGSTSNLTWRQLYGTGSTAASVSETKWNIRVAANNNTANTFGNYLIYLPNYRSSVAKSVSVDGVTENNATGAWQGIHAGLWNDTSPITSLEFNSDGKNFLQYTSASLYGILAGSDGIVSVS